MTKNSYIYEKNTSSKCNYCKIGNIRKDLFFREFREDKFANSRISRKFNKRKNENSRILNFMKSPKIRNTLKFYHAKINRFTVKASTRRHFSNSSVIY